jgi:hypothetical protein
MRAWHSLIACPVRWPQGTLVYDRTFRGLRPREHRPTWADDEFSNGNGAPVAQKIQPLFIEDLDSSEPEGTRCSYRRLGAVALTCFGHLAHGSRPS